MARAFHLYLAVLLSVVCYSTNAVSLDCGELSAADCKVQFETKYENKLEELYLKLDQVEVDRYLDYWNAVLRDLPENDPHVPVLQETIKKLHETASKLNEDFDDPKKLADVVCTIDRISEPNFIELNTDKNSQKLFDEVATKNGYKDVMESSSPSVEGILMPEVSDTWEKLYSGLRSTDRAAYPQYEDFNARFLNFKNKENTPEQRAYYFALFTSGFTPFFNLPLLTALEKCQ